MVMIKSAFVNIWGETIGAIAWDENRLLGSFEYDSTFLTKGLNLSPLKMPISSGKQIFKHKVWFAGNQMQRVAI